MFNEVQNLVQRFETGDVDTQSVSQAAQTGVQSMPHDDVVNHVNTAVSNAQSSGETGVAQQLLSMVQQNQGNPGGLKQEVVSLITSNPQVLQHFAPEFAQKILGNL